MSGAAARKIRLIMELRRQGVTDTRVLSAIERVPREVFIAEPFLDRAYENVALPIGCGQTVSQPLVVGLMTQALEVGERMRVLEVGTGSGYQAAVLSRLCRRLYTVERYRQLHKAAEARFRQLGLSNVTTQLGDGSRGWPEQAPFDRILVTAAAAELPQPLLDQLAPAGIMVLPLGPASDQWVVRVRQGEAAPAVEKLLPVRFVPLISGPLPDDTRKG